MESCEKTANRAKTAWQDGKGSKVSSGHISRTTADDMTQ